MTLGNGTERDTCCCFRLKIDHGYKFKLRTFSLIIIHCSSGLIWPSLFVRFMSPQRRETLLLKAGKPEDRYKNDEVKKCSKAEYG